jgi:DNA-binding transcriptional LysR family regulator
MIRYDQVRLSGGNDGSDGHARARGVRLGPPAADPHTRSVAPTEAGERLLRTVGPGHSTRSRRLAALSELREKQSGTIRITAGEHAGETILWPALERLLPDYPDVNVEILQSRLAHLHQIFTVEAR